MRRKRQRCVKAFIIFVFFAFLTIFSPATVGSAEKGTPAVITAARGLARSVAQTSTTFTVETVRHADKQTVSQTNAAANMAVSSAASTSAAAAATALSVPSQSSSSAIVQSVLPNSTSTSNSSGSSLPITYALPVSKSSSSALSSVPAARQAGSAPAINDIAWLIQRESAGNPNAENDSHKGIGQLSDAIYQQYLGRSWDEVKGNYQLQLQAMTAYIENRYGNVAAAIVFWQQHGWY